MGPYFGIGIVTVLEHSGIFIVKWISFSANKAQQTVMEYTAQGSI